MPSSIFCPACKQKNKTTATECVYCGSPLHRPHTTTINISSSGQTSTIEPETQLDIPKGSFALSIRISDKEPVTLFEDRSPVILGRPTLPEQAERNLIDLTPYKAIELGVSRSHVKITKTETGYVFEDLGSSNGTWLNRSTRLSPNRQYLLRNGDEFRLGKLVIHFHCNTETDDLPNGTPPNTAPLV